MLGELDGGGSAEAGCALVSVVSEVSVYVTGGMKGNEDVPVELLTRLI